MRAVLVIACILAVGAVAQETQWDGSLGYKINTEVDKTNGVGYVKINIPDYVLSNTTYSWLRVQPSALALSARSAHVKLWVNKDKINPTTTTVAPNVDKSGATEVQFDEFVHRITEAGDHFVTIQSVECKACRSTTEIQFGFFAQQTSTNTAPTKDDAYVPFAIRDDPLTAKYSLPPNKYGAAGFVDLEFDMDIYIKLEVDSSTRLAAQVAFVYQKDSVPTANPVSITEDTDLIKKFPHEAPRTGNYMTNAKKLTAGRWYIAPYVTQLTGFSTTSFDFAVGLGHEPSGVGALVPSLTVLLATVVGLLFFTF